MLIVAVFDFYAWLLTDGAGVVGDEAVRVEGGHWLLFLLLVIVRLAVVNLHAPSYADAEPLSSCVASHTI